MLYVGRRYTSRVSGSVLKGAFCENCDCEYLYKMERTAEGQGSSPYYLDNAGAQRRAQEGAIRALTTALKGIDAVPCPSCGWYQKNMLSKLGGNYGWLLACWITGLFAMLICYAVGFEPLLYASAITAFFFFLWLILRRNFNPNLLAHTRVAKRPRGVPEAILRSVLEPKLGDLEENAQGALRRAFDEIDAAKAKQAGGFKPPQQDPAVQEQAESDRKRRMWIQLGVTTLATGAALVAIGPIATHHAEADYYKQAISRKANTREVDQYLANYPNGPHAQELRDLRDDTRYDSAANIARSTHAPQALRDYLGDAANTRHRDEAKQLRRTVYLEAVAKLENQPHNTDFDAAFSGAVAAALKAQADADNPAITLNIVSTYDLEANTEELKKAETQSKETMLSKYPALQQMLKEQPEADKIVATGNLTQPQVELTRNLLIVSRFQEAIDTACGAHLVSFTPVVKVEKGTAPQATIDVKYHVRPLGDLTIFTMTEEPPRPKYAPPPDKPKVRLAGFIRTYVTEWECSFNVPNFKQSAWIGWACAPDPEFEFQSGISTTNSDWEIYAAMLHNATYRSGQIMSKKLGLPEPKIFNTYGPNGPENPR